MRGTEANVTLVRADHYDIAFSPVLGECMPLAGYVLEVEWSYPPPPGGANGTNPTLPPGGNGTAPVTGSPTATESDVATSSPTAASESNVATSSPTVAATDSNVATSSPTVAASDSNVATSSPTVAASDSNVATSSPTAAATDSNEATSSPTVTATESNVATSSPTVEATDSNVTTSSPTVAATESNEATSSPTVTASDSNVATSSPTVAATDSNVATSSPTVTATDSNVVTSSPTEARHRRRSLQQALGAPTVPEDALASFNATVVVAGQTGLSGHFWLFKDPARYDVGGEVEANAGAGAVEALFRTQECGVRGVPRTLRIPNPRYSYRARKSLDPTLLSKKRSHAVKNVAGVGLSIFLTRSCSLARSKERSSSIARPPVPEWCPPPLTSSASKSAVRAWGRTGVSPEARYECSPSIGMPLFKRARSLPKRNRGPRTV
eukprot:1182448-Prorocentrum_minimum.AAC.21